MKNKDGALVFAVAVVYVFFLMIALVAAYYSKASQLMICIGAAAIWSVAVFSASHVL